MLDRNDRLKIARMDLVFDNGKIIELLKRRGEAIKNVDHGTVFQTEHLIKLQRQ